MNKLLGTYALIAALVAIPTIVNAEEIILRTGYKYSDFPQDRLRLIPVVESTPVVPDDTREIQHAFFSELTTRFNKDFSNQLHLEGRVYAQAYLGPVNSVGLQTDDMLVNISSFDDDYYFGATFPELYFGYDKEMFSFDVGVINPVHGYASLVVSDVFAKSREFASIRTAVESATELRQGNFGVRYETNFGNNELSLIYMPDIPSVHGFSNFGHRAYARIETEYSFGNIAFFTLYQTRDNYDGAYSAILDVFCTTCDGFDVPQKRENDNASVGYMLDAGITDTVTLYSEAILAKNTAKFLISQDGPVTGEDQEADANNVSYRRHDKGPYLKAMVGAQYSFSSSALFRTEFTYDQSAYSKSERKAWLDLLDLSLGLRSDELYGDMRDFNLNFGTFSKTYGYWNFEKRLGRRVDNVLSTGQYISVNDGSFLAFLSYSHAVNSGTTLNLRATTASGGKFTDFGSIGERGTFSAYLQKTF